MERLQRRFAADGKGDEEMGDEMKILVQEYNPDEVMEKLRHTEKAR